MLRPHDGHSDEELLAAYVRSGTTDAVAALVTRHAPRLYRIAVALRGSSEVAQRLVQEVWRDVLGRGLALLSGRVPFGDILRDEVVVRALAGGAEPVSDELVGTVERAVGLLPLRERAVFVLHDGGNMSLEQVGGVLGLSVPQVKVELWHARLAVQTLLGSDAATIVDEGKVAWRETPPAALADRILADLAGEGATVSRHEPTNGRARAGVMRGGAAIAVLALSSLWLAWWRPQRIADAGEEPRTVGGASNLPQLRPVLAGPPPSLVRGAAVPPMPTVPRTSRAEPVTSHDVVAAPALAIVGDGALNGARTPATCDDVATPGEPQSPPVSLGRTNAADGAEAPEQPFDA
jgi:DNA-directed RNA polymerase specialized sigma24 family protein